MQLPHIVTMLIPWRSKTSTATPPPNSVAAPVHPAATCAATCSRTPRPRPWRGGVFRVDGVPEMW